MIGSAITCDVCGASKRATNHWIVAITAPDLEGILFVPAQAVESPRDTSRIYEDICGQLCCHKRQSIWLESWMHPQTPVADRKSTLILNPPLARDGSRLAPRESVLA